MYEYRGWHFEVLINHISKPIQFSDADCGKWSKLHTIGHFENMTPHKIIKQQKSHILAAVAPQVHYGVQGNPSCHYKCTIHTYLPKSIRSYLGCTSQAGSPLRTTQLTWLRSRDPLASRRTQSHPPCNSRCMSCRQSLPSQACGRTATTLRCVSSVCGCRQVRSYRSTDLLQVNIFIMQEIFSFLKEKTGLLNVFATKSASIN